MYEPKTSIEELWYEKIEGKISDKEWLEVMKELKVGTAPGISGISYIMIKRAEAESQKIFRRFVE